MCLSCSNEHKKHKIILYQDKLIDTKDLRKKMIEFENVINKLKLNLEGIAYFSKMPHKLIKFQRLFELFY